MVTADEYAALRELKALDRNRLVEPDRTQQSFFQTLVGVECRSIRVLRRTSIRLRLGMSDWMMISGMTTLQPESETRVNSWRLVGVPSQSCRCFERTMKDKILPFRLEKRFSTAPCIVLWKANRACQTIFYYRMKQKCIDLLEKIGQFWMAFSPVSALTPDTNFLTFIWFRLFCCTRSLHFVSRAAGFICHGSPAAYSRIGFISVSQFKTSEFQSQRGFVNRGLRIPKTDPYGLAFRKSSKLVSPFPSDSVTIHQIFPID